MNIKQLIKKLIKIFFRIWVVFVIIGIVVVMLNKGGVFKSIKDKFSTNEYSEEVKPFNVKAGGVDLDTISSGNYQSKMYELPIDIEIWDIYGDKVLYSTPISKEDSLGKAYDLNIYNLQTGEIQIIQKIDSARPIDGATFNEKYVLWKENNKAKVMDILSKEIIYEGDSSFGEYIYENTLYLYKDGKIKEESLNDKIEKEIDLGIEDGFASNIIANSKYIAMIGRDSLVVYNKEDNTKNIKTAIKDKNYSIITMNEKRIIFSGAELKASLEYDVNTKDFKEYVMPEVFKDSYVDSINKRNAIYATFKLKDKNNLEALDILENEKITLNIDNIENKSFVVYSYNDALLIKGIGNDDKDTFRYVIKIDNK